MKQLRNLKERKWKGDFKVRTTLFNSIVQGIMKMGETTETKRDTVETEQKHAHLYNNIRRLKRRTVNRSR